MKNVKWMMIAMVLSACGQTGTISDDAQGSGRTLSGTAPLSLAEDAADRECQVVLRDAHRLPGCCGGFEEQCTDDGQCWYVWGVWVDVSEAALEAGGEPRLLYQSGSDPTWWAIDPEAGEQDGAPGMRRFTFRMFEHTVNPGMSMSALMRTHIQLVPFVQFAEGGRLFDHNRNPDDFENYHLVADNQWSIGDDPAVCPGARESSATLQFKAGWQHEQHGAIVAGGTLRVEYDPARLPQCRASYTFAPVWSLEARGRFWPGGQEFSGSLVEASRDDYGRRVEPVLSIPVEVQVPADATSVELWFYNWKTYGGLCEAWDSRYGQNYLFPVERQTPAPVLWAGDWGHSLSRACTWEPGLEDPVSIDGYMMERACMMAFADVYVPGLTDGSAERPEWVLARAEIRIDDGPETTEWLAYQGRVGNNYRYRWEFPRERMSREPWEQIRFVFGFSTDGQTWTRIGAGDQARTLLRAFDRDGW